MTPAAIGSAGEGHTTAELAARGYACKTYTQLPGATDIEATKKGSPSLLVQVKTAVAPNLPSGLSPQEDKAIKARAVRIGCEAWLAQLQIDDQGKLVGTIRWTRLI